MLLFYMLMHLGEQWNDDADGHMSGEGQSHLDHGDMNNSARGRPLLLLTQVNNKKVEIKYKKIIDFALILITLLYYYYNYY